MRVATEIERFYPGYQTATMLPQRTFRVRMCAPDGDVIVRVKAGSIESVIDQVKGRRLATPPGMTGFSVDDDDG